jgi:hypothetical protein
MFRKFVKMKKIITVPNEVVGKIILYRPSFYSAGVSR